MAAPAATTEVTPAADIMSVLGRYQAEVEPVLEHCIPRKFTDDNLKELYGAPRYKLDAQTLTDALSTPIWDLLDRGGKRWRPALMLLVAQSLGKPKETVLDLVSLCEVVHNGTLMVDDIEDRSELRRGKPCVHLIYDVDVAVNAGNAMYFLPLVALRQRRPSLPAELLLNCYEVYSQEMINLHFGQGLDIWWHSGKKTDGDPSIEEYLQMCAFKTGTLARLSAKVSAIVCGASESQVEAYGRFAESIGVAFQIQDDILNLVGEEFGKTKGVGEDIHEGKRTLMVLHCLQVSPPTSISRLREILAQHPTDQTVIDEAIALIQASGSIDFAREKAQLIVRHAWAEIDSLIAPSEAKNHLKAFADYLIDRQI